MPKTERIFQIIIGGKKLILIGRAQVAELIGLLGQALVDAEELDGKPIRESWSQRWENEPVKIECRKIEAPIGLGKRMLSGKPVPLERVKQLEK